jgi:Protein of unknown function (DUF3800)
VNTRCTIPDGRYESLTRLVEILAPGKSNPVARKYQPRDFVRALVSGLPEPRRSRRLLLMLQGYIDNSGWDGDSPAFVMAGYVASEKQWEAFSQDWQAVLDLETPSKLTCLKMAQAYRLKDPNSQFYGWTEKQRDERLIEFAKTINKHAAVGVVSVIPIEPYVQLFKGKFKPMALDRPYFLSFFGMLIRLLRVAQDAKEDRIEFFFDTEGGESAALIHEQYEVCMAMAPPEVRALSAGPPSFRHDDELNPLQAADMISWLSRRYYYDLLSGRAPGDHPSHIFLANLFLPEHDIIDVWSPEMLQGAHDSLALNIQQIAWAEPIKRD